ncbi:mediator complex [Culex quinquefasciatus]|uniref:Mediator of RNA polymerase II transcription subunit 4 n=1 Tax=Culex quinquefasciatus TaxID=7176 RepID=B0W034_CULQU|nr:mediator complex [Culex quinquefasciatus]|eukprot:XP_001842068.1 mediator complex [Culex quinquefasciatus]
MLHSETMNVLSSGTKRVLVIADHAQLVELLVSKDKEMKSTLQLAADQAGIERKLDGLRDQVRDQDKEINQLQKQLKEAEYILATSIFQARQKLTSFAKATKRPMRLGFLCNSAINGHQNPASQNNPGEINRTGAAGGSEITPGGFGGIGEITVSAQNQFAWHLSVELHMTMGGGSSIPLDTRAGGQDYVEVMSTDSSSSSSSDSQ